MAARRASNPHVIGDFTWTGWDYLGEAGIGRVDYPDDDYVPTGIAAPYPWLAAWVGDIDITGHRRPVSYYRETVFGLRHAPYIAVHRPQFHGRPTRTDAVVVDRLGVELELGRPGRIARDCRRLQRRRRGRAAAQRPLDRPRARGQPTRRSSLASR